MAEVLIYTKPGCHLCEDVKDQLRRLQQNHAFDLSEVNILEDAIAFEQFRHEIPVVFVNGKKAFKFYLDEKRFLRQLEEHTQ